MIEGGHNTGRSSLCFEEISSFLFSSFFDDEGTTASPSPSLFFRALAVGHTFRPSFAHDRAQDDIRCGWQVSSSACESG